jgi:hypothetical protein
VHNTVHLAWDFRRERQHHRFGAISDLNVWIRQSEEPSVPDLILSAGGASWGGSCCKEAPAI